MLYETDIEIVVEQGRKLMAERETKGKPLSYGKIAKDIGMSPASVSNFFNRKDTGDVKKISDLIRNFIERERARDETGLLAIPFAETRQATDMIEAIEFAHQYHRMVAVISPPGSGKTVTINEVIRRDPSIIRIQAANFFGASAILQEICEELRESQRGLMRALLKRIKAKLRGTGRCLIVDDTHKLRPAALDTLQTIYDQTGIGIVLFGIRSLRRMLTGFSEEAEQMASRVSGRIWEIPDVTEDDLDVILAGVMTADQRERVLEVLKKDPQLLSSPRRLCNVLEISGSLAKKQRTPLTVVHVRQAMALSA